MITITKKQLKKEFSGNMNKYDFKRKIKKQLDCSPKDTFDKKIYREYISWIICHKPKYVRINCHDDFISISNIICPNYSIGTCNKEVQQRVLRWFRWFKRTTENRDLIEKKELITGKRYTICYK